MTTSTHMGSKIGSGIYTIPDVGSILGKPYHKVSYWIHEYWDLKIADKVDSKYSWTDGKSRAIDFNTLIELVVFAQLNEAGVKANAILKAHELLSKKFITKFPFANHNVISNLSTDGRKIYFRDGTNTISSLDGTKQLNLKFIKDFFKKIDFGSNDIASRYWPMGKRKAIVVDPHHQLGQPIIDGTNIIPDTIYSMYRAGEKTKVIAFLYEIEERKVKDAIQFCKSAA